MSDRVFCNKESEAFDASDFAEGPGDVLIHKTARPHTTDGWPVELKGGRWVTTRVRVSDSPVVRRPASSPLGYGPGYGPRPGPLGRRPGSPGGRSPSPPEAG
jgi:hypothetical protein